MRSSSARSGSLTRAPVRLAGGALVAVDELPVGGGDQLGLARGQPLGQFVGTAGFVAGRLVRAGAAQVGDQGVDGVLGVLLVGADHPAWPPLDPPDDVLVAAARYPAVGVGDGPAPLVERQSRDRHTAVTDRPHHQLGWQLLALPGVFGRHPPAGVDDQFVAAQHDAFHLAVALDLDRRCHEPEHQAAVPRAGFAARIVAQRLDVLLDRLARRGRVLVGDAVQLGGVDDHIDPLEVGELA